MKTSVPLCALSSEVYPASKFNWNFTNGFDFSHSLRRLFYRCWKGLRYNLITNTFLELWILNFGVLFEGYWFTEVKLLSSLSLRRVKNRKFVPLPSVNFLVLKKIHHVTFVDSFRYGYFNFSVLSPYSNFFKNTLQDRHTWIVSSKTHCQRLLLSQEGYYTSNIIPTSTPLYLKTWNIYEINDISAMDNSKWIRQF